MGLITVPREKLLEDGGTDLFEAEFQYLGLDGVADGFGIHVCFGEVEVGNAEGDRTIAEAGLQDLRANFIASQAAEVISAKPAGEVIVRANSVDHDARRLGKLDVEPDTKHGRAWDRNQPGEIDGAGDAHVANIRLAAGGQWTIGHRQEDGRVHR